MIKIIWKKKIKENSSLKIDVNVLNIKSFSFKIDNNCTNLDGHFYLNFVVFVENFVCNYLQILPYEFTYKFWKFVGNNYLHPIYFHFFFSCVIRM